MLNSIRPSRMIAVLLMLVASVGIVTFSNRAKATESEPMPPTEESSSESESLNMDEDGYKSTIEYGKTEEFTVENQNPDELPEAAENGFVANAGGAGQGDSSGFDIDEENDVYLAPHPETGVWVPHRNGQPVDDSGIVTGEPVPDTPTTPETPAEQPTQPTQPTEPAPTQPTQPTEPAPTQPTNPAPTQPTQPDPTPSQPIVTPPSGGGPVVNGNQLPPGSNVPEGWGEETPGTIPDYSDGDYALDVKFN